MVKFLLGILTGIVLVVALLGVMVLVAFTLGSEQPGIEDDSVLVMRLRGGVPEHVGIEMSFGSWDSKTPATLLEVRNAFKKAAKDDRIRAIALHCGGLGAGWGKSQEIRWAIEEFKESGKPIVAFIQVEAGTLDYFVASAADEVYLAPEAFLDVKGLRAEVSFYKDTLEKLGVTAEMQQIGKYKSAAEPWSRSSMSDESREVIESILDEVYGQFLETVAPSRDMTSGALREVVDNGPFISKKALEAGLVDKLGYEDEFYDALKEKLGLEELKKVSFSRYRNVSLESLDLTGDAQIAIVYAVGSILRGEGESGGLLGADILGSDSFSRTLREVKEDEDIKAVVLRIDSPGGDAIASDQMWREVNRLREEKPMVVSMSNLAASGGYYIAMAEAPVVAYPGTYTGSIGVFYGKVNLRGLYDKIGIKKEVITRGRFAAIDSDYHGFTDAERAKVRESIEAIYQGFVEKVAQSRGQKWGEIHEVAQGRVWMGSQAERNGLVDEIGGFDTAIEMAKEAAGIPEEDKVTLIIYPAPKPFFEVLFEGDWLVRESPALALLRSVLQDVPHWPALLEGGFLRMPPYSIRIQ